jgi:hypothetical protein
MYLAFLRNGDAIVEVDSGGVPRTLDFKRMEQINQRCCHGIWKLARPTRTTGTNTGLLLIQLNM